MEIRVLLIKDKDVTERTVIKAVDLDPKKHLHLSGREFTADEVKGFKAAKAPKPTETK